MTFSDHYATATATRNICGSRAKQLFQLGFALIILFVFAWLFVKQASLFGQITCGLCLFVICLKTEERLQWVRLGNRPFVVLTDRGMTYRLLSETEIPWASVKHIIPMSRRGRMEVTVSLQPGSFAALGLSRWVRLRPAVGLVGNWDRFTITSAPLDIVPNDLKYLLQDFTRQHSPGAIVTD